LLSKSCALVFLSCFLSPFLKMLCHRKSSFSVDRIFVIRFIWSSSWNTWDNYTGNICKRRHVMLRSVLIILIDASAVNLTLSSSLCVEIMRCFILHPIILSNNIYCNALYDCLSAFFIPYSFVFSYLHFFATLEFFNTTLCWRNERYERKIVRCSERCDLSEM